MINEIGKQATEAMGVTTDAVVRIGFGEVMSLLQLGLVFVMVAAITVISIRFIQSAGKMTTALNESTTSIKDNTKAINELSDSVARQISNINVNISTMDAKLNSFITRIENKVFSIGEQMLRVQESQAKQQQLCTDTCNKKS